MNRLTKVSGHRKFLNSYHYLSIETLILNEKISLAQDTRKKNSYKFLSPVQIQKERFIIHNRVIYPFFFPVRSEFRYSRP